jgi:hypothetical protein
MAHTNYEKNNYPSEITDVSFFAPFEHLIPNEMLAK